MATPGQHSIQPPPIFVGNRAVGWRPLAFLNKDERESTYKLQDSEGRERTVILRPSATAAWIADEPDERGNPIIVLLSNNSMEVRE